MALFKSMLATAMTSIALFAQVTQAQSAEIDAVSTARQAIVAATLVNSSDAKEIEKRAEAIVAAEFALAAARAKTFAATGGIPQSPQASPNFSPRQYDGMIPGIKEAQTALLTQMTNDLMLLIRSVNRARMALAAASISETPDGGNLHKLAEAIGAAEFALANARASSFAKIQSSPNMLSSTQVAALLEMGGSFASVQFTKPKPLNFADHAGYVALFDGATLKGWDGNPKFWRAEDGAIVGESSVQNPSGNSYIVYRDVEAKDFTLKFEIKVEGPGGSGLQYRSKTGIPWLANIPDNVTANVGPVNLAWMMTGPQADFWPNAPYWTGQFYSENTPMRILAWRGQVVEGAGLSRKQLMGNIGDLDGLGRLVKKNYWNEYTVIARGGTLIQILNGQLMAVMVDDDPESSNNQAGLFGIEIEATTKVSVRNIWLKKLK